MTDALSGTTVVPPGDDLRSRVKFCPNCAHEPLHLVLVAADPLNPNFDAYCHNCNWSGDISPDRPGSAP